MFQLENFVMRWVRVSAMLMAALISASAHSQSVRVVQDASLRADRGGGDAAPIGALAANMSVSLVQLSGGWAQVQSIAPSGNTVVGWVRASSLDLRPPETSVTSRIETGRRAPDSYAITLGTRHLAPRSNRHALIIGIGAYRLDAGRSVGALQGMDRDMQSALDIARALQVPTSNLTLLRDAAATREGIASAIRRLNADVSPGDRVFVYWSGRGSSVYDAESGACVDSLMSADLQDITYREFARSLEPIGANADKMLVFVDAGRAARRAQPLEARTATNSPDVQSKSTIGTGSCGTSEPDGSMAGNAITPYVGTRSNVVRIMSSSPAEDSSQGPLTGGLATFALRRCLLGDATDADGSGSVDIGQVVACAQAGVDRANVDPRARPQHLVLDGNPDFVPIWADSTARAKQIGPAPAASMPIVSMERVLEKIHSQRDAEREIEVTSSLARMRINRDSLSIKVTSKRAGYVFVAMLGSDGQSLTVVFPNRSDADNYVRAGQSLSLPRLDWSLLAGGPAGMDHLLVMVTDAPRNLAELASQSSGPFIEVRTDAAGRAVLQRVLGACSGENCSDNFGSALIEVEEYSFAPP